MYDAVLKISFACILVVNSVRCKPLEFRAYIGDSHSDMGDVRIFHASSIEVGVMKIGKFGQYICDITLVETSGLERTRYSGKGRTSASGSSNCASQNSNLGDNTEKLSIVDMKDLAYRWYPASKTSRFNFGIPPIVFKASSMSIIQRLSVRSATPKRRFLRFRRDEG